MKYKNNKILKSILVLLMVFMLLPVNALAEELPVEPVTEDVNNETVELDQSDEDVTDQQQNDLTEEETTQENMKSEPGTEKKEAQETEDIQEETGVDSKEQDGSGIQIPEEVQGPGIIEIREGYETYTSEAYSVDYPYYDMAVESNEYGITMNENHQLVVPSGLIAGGYSVNLTATIQNSDGAVINVVTDTIFIFVSLDNKQLSAAITLESAQQEGDKWIVKKGGKYIMKLSVTNNRQVPTKNISVAGNLYVPGVENNTQFASFFPQSGISLQKHSTEDGTAGENTNAVISNLGAGETVELKAEITIPDHWGDTAKLNIYLFDYVNYGVEKEYEIQMIQGADVSQVSDTPATNKPDGKKVNNWRPAAKTGDVSSVPVLIGLLVLSSVIMAYKRTIKIAKK